MSCRKLKCGAYIFICSLHTALTLGVFSTLFLKHTELHDSFVLNKDLGYGIAFVSLLGLSLLMYYIACFLDPGFVPINRKSVTALDSEDEEEHAKEHSTMLPVVKLRRCGFCGIEQPLRARHCEDCDRCVRKFDHHCPWLGNCVGENNHKFFWLFLLSKSAVILWGAVIVWRAFEEHATWPEWFYHNLLFVLDFVVLVPAGITVIALFFMHTYCMMANITSWEFVSRERITYLKSFDEDLNPFHEGYLGNTFYFLCRCRTRSWEKVYDRFRRLRGSNNV